MVGTCVKLSQMITKATPHAAGGSDAHGESPNHGKPRPREDLHQPRGTPESNDPHVHAPPHVADERLQLRRGKTCGLRTGYTSPTTTSAGFARHCASRLRWKRGRRRGHRKSANCLPDVWLDACPIAGFVCRRTQFARKYPVFRYYAWYYSRYPRIPSSRNNSCNFNEIDNVEASVLYLDTPGNQKKCLLQPKARPVSLSM